MIIEVLRKKLGLQSAKLAAFYPGNIKADIISSTASEIWGIPQIP